MSVISNTIKTGRSLISRPRVTEKATSASLAKYPVFTFEVSAKANKIEIAKEIFAKYKVQPVKVNIVNLPARKVFVRGRIGSTPAVKKAMVYLKPGEKIELI